MDSKEREYVDPAERYEDLHREQREEEQRYDEYLNDDTYEDEDDEEDHGFDGFARDCPHFDMG